MLLRTNCCACVWRLGEPMSRRYRNTTIVEQSADSVLTWLFAGLTIIALVAGLLAQITG